MINSQERFFYELRLFFPSRASVCNKFNLYFIYMWLHATVSSPDRIMRDEQILNLRNSCIELNQHSPAITISLTLCPCRCSNARNASEPTLASPVFLRKHIQKLAFLRRGSMWNPLGNHSPMYKKRYLAWLHVGWMFSGRCSILRN